MQKSDTKNYKNEKILNIFVIENISLIINTIRAKIYSQTNIFIKHLVHLKNTLYLCAH